MTSLVKIIITAIVSYLVGSVSPAILLGKARGINIKKEGSGNAGTTNVLRVMGGKAALITLTVDILKGVLPALIFASVFGSDTYGYIACIAAFFGHVFPIYYGFKGGKGVAVAFGGSKRMSVGSIAGAASAIIYALIFEKSFLIYIIIMAGTIIYMHRGNIKRLINHEEPTLSFLDKKKGSKG